MRLWMIEADVRVLWKYKYSYMQYNLIVMGFSTLDSKHHIYT